jgi:hypothetical protein
MNTDIPPASAVIDRIHNLTKDVKEIIAVDEEIYQPHTAHLRCGIEL